MDETQLFDIDAVKKTLIEMNLDEIADAIKEKGYNPVSQIVGYLISGDESYITTHKDARKKIMEYDRVVLLETIISDYLGVL